MKVDPHPLRTPMIRPADEVLRIDLTEPTQEVLRRQSQRVFPTVKTTQGHRAWKWGRPADGPSNSGAPLIFSPSDLLRERGQADAPSPSIDDVIRRLRP
jgi:hypothetical protein